MNQAPSYEELKESECFWLQVMPYIAGMSESLDGMINEPIVSRLYYETKVTEVDEGFEFPFQEVRIDILERSSEEIQSLSGKYPIGFFEFNENGASATLMCRSELVSRMISTLGMAKDHEVQFFLTIPVLPSQLPNIYPILNFQYRVRSLSADANT